MATRTQIDRIARQIDKLAAKHEATTIIPVYANETEAEALKAHGQPVSGSVVFNRVRQGDRREDCEASGLHALYCLNPSEVRRLLAQIDSKTRRIPTTCNLLPSQKEATA